MAVNESINVYIGFDSREAVASYVAANSIKKRTQHNISIKYLKHRELRRSGIFARPWLIKPDTGDYEDLIDARPFTTEFSHTRFLIPELQKFQGWALFFDSDMIFLSDIKKLFEMKNDKYAVMCVHHQHTPVEGAVKMDHRLQNVYHRKNWSSFVLWNCSHPSNRKLTKEKVNFMKGADLHSFSWLADHEIGRLPYSYNYISGISPTLPFIDGRQVQPDVIHYTEGGPWFDTCKDVPYAKLWVDEFEDWCRDGDASVMVSQFPTTRFDRLDHTRKR